MFFFCSAGFIQGMTPSSHKFQQLGAGLHLLVKSRLGLETYTKTETTTGACSGNVTDVAIANNKM